MMSFSPRLQLLVFAPTLLVGLLFFSTAAPCQEDPEAESAMVAGDSQSRLLMEVLDLLKADVRRMEKIKGTLSRKHQELLAKVKEVEERIAALDGKVEAQRRLAARLVRSAVRLKAPSDLQLLVASERYHDLLLYRRTVNKLLGNITRRMEKVKVEKARWELLAAQARQEMKQVQSREARVGQELADVQARLKQKKNELEDREQKIAAVSSLFMAVPLDTTSAGEQPDLDPEDDPDGPGEKPEVEIEKAAVEPRAKVEEKQLTFGEVKGTRELSIPVSPGRIIKRFDREVEGDLGTEKMSRGWILTPHVEKGQKMPQKAEVRAPFPGKMVYSGHIPGFGMTMILEHGPNYHTVYSNLYKLEVGMHEEVKQDQVIGLIKSLRAGSPPYVYFEVRENRVAVDPRPWFVLRPVKPK